MRIAYLICTDGISGAEKNLLDLMPAVKKNGVYCELICVCSQKNREVLQQYCDEISYRGIKATLFTISSKFSYFNLAKRIAKHLKANNFNVVNSHLINSDLIAVLAKTFFYKELVILSTKHGYEEKYLVQYGLGNKKIRYNYYYFITRMIMKRIDHNLAISRAVSQMYSHLKFVKKPMHYIHHGIAPLPPNPNHTMVEGNPKIMIVGRLAKMKGHEYVIKALPEIVKKFPTVKLIIVGIGPLKVELLQLAGSLNMLEHIEFTGFANPTSYISQCEVMILPSLFEPFGLVYIESFACKIPVVAFDTQAGNEIIENNETGFLVEKENAEALAEKIIYLLENPQERKRIAENAFYKFENYYNVDRMAREVTDWYQLILNTE